MQPASQVVIERMDKASEVMSPKQERGKKYDLKDREDPRTPEKGETASGGKMDESFRSPETEERVIGREELTDLMQRGRSARDRASSSQRMREKSEERSPIGVTEKRNPKNPFEKKPLEGFPIQTSEKHMSAIGMEGVGDEFNDFQKMFFRVIISKFISYRFNYQL